MAKHDEVVLAGGNELEIIEFYIDEASASGVERRRFGVNVAKVLEVIERPKRLSESAKAVNPCNLGAIPLRDLILPVIDLAVWLKLAKRESAFEVILVTEFNRTVTGFLVSGVTQIHRVSWSEVEPPSKSLSGLPQNCITGLVRIGENFVLLLDLEKVLAELDPASVGEDVAVQDGAPLYRALIVDDSTTLRLIIKKNIEASRFSVSTLNNGQEAWDRLLELKARAAAEGKRPKDFLDVVISDVEMPLMDGYTLTKKIKDDPVLKELPVVLFSSLISNEQRHKGDSVGADDQRSKPEFGELAGRAAALINTGRRA